MLISKYPSILNSFIVHYSTRIIPQNSFESLWVEDCSVYQILLRYALSLHLLFVYFSSFCSFNVPHFTKASFTSFHVL